MTNTPSVEEVLRVSEIRYRRLFETAQDGILILDGNSGSIVDVNPFLFFLLGYSHQEFIGKKLWELGAFQDVEANKDRFQTLVENDYIQYNDLPLRTKDGRVIAVEFVSNVYMVGNEKTIQCNIRDITARKKAEKGLHDKEMQYEGHLREAQKIESMGTLAGGVAHEFNNILAMILPSAEMIAATADSKTKTAVYAARIIEAATRGAGIVKQLSIFAHSEEGEAKPTSLQRIVLDIGSLLSHTIRREIAVRTEISAPNSIVMGDNGLLHQAVLNLALNAVDAMPRGGTLTLVLMEADQDDMMRVVDRTGPGGDQQQYIILSVRDTGGGIDEATRERIFDPFFTTKESGKGTGLGLSIVHGIVKSHHGYHSIDTTPYGGTTVSLYFPLHEQVMTPVVQPAAVPIAAGRRTILVLDDEEAIRETLSELLSNEGYTVLTACDGLEGMQQLRDHHPSIDLVITDLGMPRMNGEQFFTQAKAFDPALKTIITTGYIQTQTKSKLFALGVVDLILKPFTVSTLIPAVRRALEAA